MKVSGLQKLTLLDYPGLIACTIFTPGCNFCCPFCHNSALVVDSAKADIIPTEQILSFLKDRFGRLDGVCITGGEPLLQPDLEDFIRRIKDIGYKVKLDTNGYLPDKLRALVDRRLIDYVAMDVKNSLDKYGMTVGISSFNTQPIKESIAFLESDQVDYEFRTTAVKEYHTLDDFKKIGELIKGAKQYYIQDFVDSGSVIKSGLHGFEKPVLEEFLEEVKDKVVKAELRGVE